MTKTKKIKIFVILLIFIILSLSVKADEYTICLNHKCVIGHSPWVYIDFSSLGGPGPYTGNQLPYLTTGANCYEDDYVTPKNTNYGAGKWQGSEPNFIHTNYGYSISGWDHMWCYLEEGYNNMAVYSDGDCLTFADGCPNPPGWFISEEDDLYHNCQTNAYDCTECHNVCDGISVILYYIYNGEWETITSDNWGGQPIAASSSDIFISNEVCPSDYTIYPQKAIFFGITCLTKTQLNYYSNPQSLKMEWINEDNPKQACCQPTDMVNDIGECQPSDNQQGGAVSAAETGNDIFAYPYYSNDNDQGWIDCDGTNGPNYWCSNICSNAIRAGESNIGEYSDFGFSGELECCGDDSNENYCQENTYSEEIAFDNNEQACCNAQSDCTANFLCYTKENVHGNLNFNNNDNYAYCHTLGKWGDCDSFIDTTCGSSVCGSISGVKSGESSAHGEYTLAQINSKIQKCCGDDLNEHYNTRNLNPYEKGTSLPQDSNDEACCNEDDCVWDNNCYDPVPSSSDHTTYQKTAYDNPLGTSGNNKKIICSAWGNEKAVWGNPDYASSWCEVANGYWNVGFGNADEESTFYTDTYLLPDSAYCKITGDEKPSTRCCCGDDQGEYYITNDLLGTQACCSNENACIDSEGNCQLGAEICDGLDNDCDGIIDNTGDALCDDNIFCNGQETCEGTSNCQPGTPIDCDDNVGCTDDTCNENTDSCDNTPNHISCDDELYCNGEEYCDVLLDCQLDTPIDCNDNIDCTDDICNEDTNSCNNIQNNLFCDNNLWCDGTEYCDINLDCQSNNNAPDCDDTITCTDDSCNEVADTCDNIPNHDNCPKKDEIAICTNNPDNKDFTYDFAPEIQGICTLSGCQYADYQFTHECSDDDLLDGIGLILCNAGCDQDTDCLDTLCQDGCEDLDEDGKLDDYADYKNIINNCLLETCTCEQNLCQGPINIYIDDSRCIPPATQCTTNEDCESNECCYQQHELLPAVCINSLPAEISSGNEIVEQNPCLCMISKGQPRGDYCTNTGDSPCWDNSTEQCCGNEDNEDWGTLYSTHDDLEDILIKGYCENSAWKSREDSTLTDYDVWT